MAVLVGKKAPQFCAQAVINGGEFADNFSLDQFIGKKHVVLFFYPKDFTPGCTTEACSFRDKYGHFSKLNIPVIGISRDSVAIHIKFVKKYNLPFDLLSDPSGEVADLYHAILPFVKINKQISYFIDDTKTIRGVYTNFFKAVNHIKEMLRSAGRL